MHAYGGGPPPRDFFPQPAQVRAFLAGHGPLLAVLDDVWDARAIQPLCDALPSDAAVLITTRDEALANDLAPGRVRVLRVLPTDPALELLRVRARHAWRTHAAILRDLANCLGHHPLALDLAGRRLARIAPGRGGAFAKEVCVGVREGTVFAHLSVPAEMRQRSVEAVLQSSYQEALSAPVQTRFRALGAFAPDTSFQTESVASVWGCSKDAAWEQLAELADLGLVSRVEGDALDAGRSRWQQHSLLRAYALALLRQSGEEEKAREIHAAVQRDLVREARERQIQHELWLDHAQLAHAFDWAVDHSLGVALDLAANSADMQHAFGLSRVAITWAERLLQGAQSVGEEALLAAAQGNLGIALRNLAGLAGEDRRERLYQALAAFDAALEYYAAAVAPLQYAAIENNKGNALLELAGLAGEDRRGRLLDALAAYEAALEYCTLAVAPLDFAMTQNNKGTVLYELAGLAGEDRRGRLLDALVAYDAALQYRNPAVAPLHYATTQNNKGNALWQLAGLPGEDRRGRLYQALAVFDAALEYCTSAAAPLDYAGTQNNKGTVLSALAALEGEDRRGRLYQALAAFDAALKFRTPVVAPLDHAGTQNNKGNALLELAGLAGEDRRGRLLEALAAYEAALEYYTPEVAPLGYATTQGNRGNVLRQLAMLADDDQRQRLLGALKCGVAAVGMFAELDDGTDREIAIAALRVTRRAAGAEFETLWAELELGAPPDWLVDDGPGGAAARR